MSNYIQQGKILVSQKEYTKAFEYFQAAIQNDSTCSEAYLLLSDCYYYLGRIQQSQSTLYSLLSKDPNNQKAKKRLNIIQTAITEQSSSHTNQSSLRASQSTINKYTTIHQSKSQSPQKNIKSASIWEWSTGNLISGIIGLFFLILSIWGIIDCLPIDGYPLDYSYEWASLLLFMLLTFFSSFMILSPLIKPSWKIKNVIFAIFGLFVAPISLGVSINDFEHNGQFLIIMVIGIAFVFAPFIKVD